MSEDRVGRLRVELALCARLSFEREGLTAAGILRLAPAGEALPARYALLDREICRGGTLWVSRRAGEAGRTVASGSSRQRHGHDGRAARR